MKFCIEKITAENYPLFQDMVWWRMHGTERQPDPAPPSERMLRELSDPGLHVFAVRAEGRFVGWISLVYIPKLGGRWAGRGHLYVDELWVSPDFRGRGMAKALLARADEMAAELDATGLRLYVNVENPAARHLYRACGFRESGTACFMEK